MDKIKIFKALLDVAMHSQIDQAHQVFRVVAFADQIDLLASRIVASQVVEMRQPI